MSLHFFFSNYSCVTIKVREVDFASAELFMWPHVYLVLKKKIQLLSIPGPKDLHKKFESSLFKISFFDELIIRIL